MDIDTVDNVNKQLEQDREQRIKDNKIRSKSDQWKYLEHKYLLCRQNSKQKDKKQEYHDSSIYYELDQK